MFRPRSIILSEVAIAFIFTVLPWIIAVAAIPDPWSTILFFVGLPAIGLAVLRAFRISVVISDDGITVKNYWRTHFLCWTDIAEVRATFEAVGVMPVPVIAFRTRKEQVVRVLASATAEKHKKTLVRQLKDCPELSNVHFNLPAHLLR